MADEESEFKVLIGGEGVTIDLPEGSAPDDGVFTLESLKKFDGRTLPMCLGICGKVVNVSLSANFPPGKGYGKVWAGKDSTWGMAKVSLDEASANKLDWELADFTSEEHKALSGWYKHFTTKYPVVGTLKEYEGRDFSSVEEEAKSQTPFGAGVEEAGNVKAADEDAAAKAEADGGLVLRKGADVKLTGLKAKPELNGVLGTIVDFYPDKGRFAIRVGEETMLLKPTNLAKP